MEPGFQNRASISKWSFDFKLELRFEMELRFQNRASISKPRASISKWSFNFKIELSFQNQEIQSRNGASISK